MSKFNKELPEEMLGNSKKPFQSEKDERTILKKKKPSTETKQAKLYASDHKRLRIAAAMSDKNMIDILSESIEMWIAENEEKNS